jgi:cytochrome c oxidase cbb3-type subunit III
MTPPSIAATAEAGVPEKAADEAPLMTHSYDGIHEYDNPMPSWWITTFWVSIVFAAGYWVWFHVTGWGVTPDAHYQAELTKYAEQKELRDAADARDVNEEAIARNARDPKVVEKGKQIFAAKCVACHAEDGRGLIGPNLTDRFQLHGTTRMDMFKTVRGGVQGTAMLAWGEQMPATDVVAVTTFVTTLRGLDIQGKEPQGQPVEPFK